MDSQHFALRAASPDDSVAIMTIAQLDSARVPDTDALVGEVDGEIVAVITMGDGLVVADPFRHTEAVVNLLRSRRAQLIADTAGRRKPRLPRLKAAAVLDSPV